MIEKDFWSRKNPIQSIKGNDFQKCTRHHRHIKRCWIYGSKTHLKRDYRSLEKCKAQIKDYVRSLKDELR